MRTVALIEHDACLHHDTGSYHPESPDRLRAVRAAIEHAGLESKLRWMRPDPIDLKALESVHSRAHVRRVEEGCLRGAGPIDGADTVVCFESFEAARLSAGGAFLAVDTVLKGEAHAAFCALRPPGHHATPEHAMGFCLFNNVALAARHAQQAHGIERVAILDWDVHHGNGTQDVFFADPTVLFASIHQYPFYPGTGSAEEIGSGPGEGYTINEPVPSGAGLDTFEAMITERFAPAVEALKPGLILISAGFDAHAADPLGGLELHAPDFARLTRLVRDLAEGVCDGRVVSVLEGGYNLKALGLSVTAHLEALLED